MKSRIAFLSRRHVDSWSGKVAASASRRARSSATQHISFEWVKCPDWRLTQIPESGSRQMRHTRSALPARRFARLAVESSSGLRVDECGLEKVAVDVELSLCGGAVAYTYRARAPVALQVECPLGCALATVQPVQHLKARVGEL